MRVRVKGGFAGAPSEGVECVAAVTFGEPYARREGVMSAANDNCAAEK
jgi:hypothetical protein